MKYSTWTKSVFFSLIIFASSFLTNCSENKASNQDRDAQLLAALASRPATVATTTSVSCSTANPAFSTLRDAGFNSSCGRSGCHDGTTRFNTTNVNQVKGFVTAGQPSSSTLYSIQNGGSMTVYTNTALSQAIFCWIQGGANN